MQENTSKEWKLFDTLVQCCFSDEARSMPDEYGYAAGDRRYELLEKLAGNKVCTFLVDIL